MSNKIIQHMKAKHIKKLRAQMMQVKDIPTVGQLAAMYLYHKDLNKALEMVGGTPMKEDTYWSSSESVAWVSWAVYFKLGSVLDRHSRYHSCFVRPCRTLELKEK